MRTMRTRLIVDIVFSPYNTGDETAMKEAVESALEKIFDNMAFLRERFSWKIRVKMEKPIIK